MPNVQPGVNSPRKKNSSPSTSSLRKQSSITRQLVGLLDYLLPVQLGSNRCGALPPTRNTSFPTGLSSHYCCLLPPFFFLFLSINLSLPDLSCAYSRFLGVHCRMGELRRHHKSSRAQAPGFFWNGLVYPCSRWRRKSGIGLEELLYGSAFIRFMVQATTSV